MSAKIITSLVVAGALVASLSVATPASALNQRERNIVGGLVLGVLGTLAVQDLKKKQHGKSQTYRTCHNSYQTYRNGRLVTVCR